MLLKISKSVLSFVKSFIKTFAGIYEPKWFKRLHPLAQFVIEVTSVVFSLAAFLAVLVGSYSYWILNGNPSTQAATLATLAIVGFVLLVSGGFLVAVQEAIERYKFVTEGAVPTDVEDMVVAVMPYLNFVENN